MVSETPAKDRAALWAGKRVFITGHTGFKGSWLTLWLRQWGAEIYGYSLPPEENSLYTHAALSEKIPGQFSDLRDYETLAKAMAQHKPDVVFHLAAQPLVRESYQDPVTTFSTNVMGAVHALEAMRHTPAVKAAVVVTSDKCYENRGHSGAFKESDRLGGHDPYSNSKACAELVSQSYRDSFFARTGAPLLATARAGNVIGGGDWAKDRLLPDAMRAFAQNQPLVVRSPLATRPWQHVLEAINGYLTLAEALLAGRKECAEAWNFGPAPQDFRSVQDVVTETAAQWGDGAAWKSKPDPKWKEAETLSLDATKATQKLGWKPKLDLKQAIALTVAWHKAQKNGQDALRRTLDQIQAYQAL